jgi:hypothetical protein
MQGKGSVQVMVERNGGTVPKNCDVRYTRDEVQASLRRLEGRPRQRWPWAQLRQETNQALWAKVLGRIDDLLFWLEKWGDLSKTPAKGEVDWPVATAERTALLPLIVTAVRSGDLSEPLLWSHERNLRNALDRVAPEAYIRAAIRNEASKDQGFGSYSEELQSANRKYANSPEEMLPTRDLLVLRKQEIDHRSRHERATVARRRELLWLFSLLLWLLVPVLAVVTAEVKFGRIDFGWWEVAAALILGGFGGSLSSMRKLRDQLERLAQMDSFRAAVWAQLAAAAGLGLFALILFGAGVLPPIGSPSSWDGLVYAFLAGFSEPFAIQAVTRLAGRDQ